MDLILYIVVISAFGVIRMNSKPTVQEQYSIIGDGITVDTEVTSSEIRIGNNLKLIRDRDAFTAILKELGLG